MDEKLWDALYAILKHSSPHKLEVECLADFCESIASPHFDGDYARAAAEALREWDV